MDRQVVKHYEQLLKSNIMQNQLNGVSKTLHEQVAQLIANDKDDKIEIQLAYNNVVREIVGKSINFFQHSRDVPKAVHSLHFGTSLSFFFKYHRY